MTHKLLVMDDNTTVQRVIRLAFQDEPIAVTTIASSRRSFKQIEANPPDIVLSDKGGEVAAFLKSRPALSHIPVVLLKGAFDAAIEGPDEAAGCADVLMKPLQPQAMIDCVKQLLREPKAGARTPSSRASTASAPAFTKRSEPDVTAELAPNLTLDQYFDRLNAAFSRAGSMAPSPPGDTWLWEPVATASRGSAPAQKASPPKSVPPAAEPPPRPAIADDLVEQVTQRVLDRLGDRVVRSTATEIVSRLSRWLIADEVERTKAGK